MKQNYFREAFLKLFQILANLGIKWVNSVLIPCQDIGKNPNDVWGVFLLPAPEGWLGQTSDFCFTLIDGYTMSSLGVLVASYRLLV